MKRKATTLDRFFGLSKKPKNTETDSEPKLLSLRTHHEHDCKSQSTSSCEVKAASPLPIGATDISEFAELQSLTDDQ
ncbi:hypothetical protein DPMN_055035, partial [Dreissena polymorpha]